MRKFKHKKLGCTAEFNPSGANYILNENRQTPMQLPSWVVEDSNDWEEMKEFPKIISFRKISDKTLYTLGRYDLYWGKEVIGGYTLDVMIAQGENTNYVEIYQVAVSETEVFTLGDRVKYYGEVCNITGIYFNEHKQLSFRTNVKSLTVPKTGVFDLDVKYSKIKKAPEPLFVTEDNIPMFKGDKFYYVSISLEHFSNCYSGYAQEGSAVNTNYKYFSTVEAAEKYILDENKPIYSKKQIEDTLINTFIGTSNGIAIFAEIFKRNLGL